MFAFKQLKSKNEIISLKNPGLDFFTEIDYKHQQKNV